MSTILCVHCYHNKEGSRKRGRNGKIGEGVHSIVYRNTSTLSSFTVAKCCKKKKRRHQVRELDRDAYVEFNEHVVQEMEEKKEEVEETFILSKIHVELHVLSIRQNIPSIQQ